MFSVSDLYTSNIIISYNIKMFKLSTLRLTNYSIQLKRPYEDPFPNKGIEVDTLCCSKSKSLQLEVIVLI